MVGPGCSDLKNQEQSLQLEQDDRENPWGHSSLFYKSYWQLSSRCWNTYWSEGPFQEHFGEVEQKLANRERRWVLRKTLIGRRLLLDSFDEVGMIYMIPCIYSVNLKVEWGLIKVEWGLIKVKEGWPCLILNLPTAQDGKKCSTILWVPGKHRFLSPL